MTRIRVFVVLILAIGLGGTFALATYRYIQNRPVKEVSLPTTPVVVAGANLPLGAELRREDLRVIAWPASGVPAGSFKDPQELVGRGLIQSITENEAVLPGKLAPAGAGAGLPPVIPDGKRAVSVRVNDVIGVAGYVLPGTHVDVLSTLSPTNQDTDMTSKVGTHQRAGTRVGHEDRAGRRAEQADFGERRHADGRSARVGTPHAGKYRGKDSARAS